MSAPLSTARPAVERFFFDPNQNSSDVTVFVMLVLLLTDWRRLVARIGRGGSSVSAALFFSAAVVLHLWSEYTQALPVDLLSLGLFLIGSALALGGWQLVRLILLPASLLLIAIPIPVVLINKLVLPLQAGTIAISTFLMDSIGRDYATFGSIIYSGERAFQVIDTCTGLRSISTMFMATLVYIRLLGESGWRAALLLTMAAPISFFFNGVRVLIIILSADMSLSEDHNVQGIMGIIASILVLHGIAEGLNRLWPPSQRSTSRPTLQFVSHRRQAAAVLGVLVCLLVGPAFVTPWKAPPDLSAWTIVMPIHWVGYEARLLRLDKNYFGSVEFDRSLHRRYEREGEPSVDVLLGMQRRIGRDQSLLSDKLGIPGSSQVLLSDSQLELTDTGIGVRRVLTRGPDGVRLSYSWFRGVGSFLEELLRAFFALDRSGFHREGGAYALQVSTIVQGQTDLADANERLTTFAAFIDGLLPDLIREKAR